MSREWGEVVSRQDPERMVTLTRIGRDRAEITSNFRMFVQKLRRGGWEWEYFGIVEPHVSGALHMHLLQWGSYVDHDRLSALAARSHMGYTWIARIRGKRAAANYCVKHLCRGHGRWVPGRVIRYSRGFWRNGRDRPEGSWDTDFQPVVFDGWYADNVDSMILAGEPVAQGAEFGDWLVTDQAEDGVIVDVDPSIARGWRHQPSAARGRWILDGLRRGVSSEPDDSDEE
ncbi:MAG: hypothetical protein ACE5F6_11735 [Anaerolineae bacterium]